MGLTGKGFWIWKIPNCESGNVESIANLAQAAHLSHVLVKIADGKRYMNVTTTGTDLVPPLVTALRARGILVYGWHYVYADDVDTPELEAQTAIQRLQGLNLDGYVIDAEVEYRNKAAQARVFMNLLRGALPTLPVGLSAYRFPTWDTQFPWTAFLEKCDFSMPQVYWEGADNPEYQLTRSTNEYLNLTPSRPVYPVGPTYKNGGWAPSSDEITRFLNTARNTLHLASASFFSWDECRRDLPGLWDTIRDYSWDAVPPPEEMPNRLAAALNSHNVDQVAALYGTNPVHVSASRTVQGLDAVRAYYTNLLGTVLPNATFTITGIRGTGNSRHFTWQATSDRGPVTNGSDTLGLMGDQISYHYTFFTPPAG